METIKKGGRGTGRTTRIIDEIIQELFNNPGKDVLILDHNASRQSSYYLKRRIERRLKAEHGGVDYSITDKEGIIKIKLNQKS